MTRRVLVCIEDTGVAHVVVSRLSKDGVDGVVVDTPAKLVESADQSVDAVVVQDRYPTGEAGSSLLRQVRVRRPGAVPAVYLLTADLSDPDRHVLGKQYKVHDFLRIEATPHSIAAALLGAAGVEPSEGGEEEPDLVLHEDEAKNQFDIDIGGADVTELEIDGPEAKGFSENAATLEVQKLDLDQLKVKKDGATDLMELGALDDIMAPPNTDPTGDGDAPPRDATREVPLALDGMTLDGFEQPSELPAPGGDDDFEFPMDAPPPVTGVSAVDPIDSEDDDSLGLDELAAAAAASLEGGAEDEVEMLDPIADDPVEPAAPVALDDPPSTVASDEGPPAEKPAPDSPAPLETDSPGAAAPRGDDMQMTDLKKALYAQKKARESAEKRVKELEDKLSKLEPQGPVGLEGGVPADGVFEDIRYPQLLSYCRAEGFTGAVKLQIGGTNTRTVYLRDGLPIGYASSEPGERIGKMMVEQGRISDEQYIKAATVMVERGIKLTEALVELGFVEAETLAVEMRNLTRDQIIQGFELTQGRFTTHEGMQPENNVSTFDFGPGEIYVQGFRQYAPEQEMQALFESLRDTYLIANARLASFRPKLGLGGEDERLLRLLGEAYTVEEAVDRAGIDPDHAARLLAALQSLDLVEEWSPGVEQFRARLKTERQLHAEEIARLREEMSEREKKLFEGFEGALAKIGNAVGGGGGASVSLSDHMQSSPPPASSGGPFGSSSSSPPESSSAGGFGGSSSGSSGNGASSSLPPLGGGSGGADSSPPEPASSSASSEPASDEGESNAFGVMPTGNSDADKKYGEGLTQAANNRLDEAEVTLREAVRMDASKPEYLLSLARVLLANPRYERAGTLPVVRSLLDRAVQIAPDNGDVKELHGQVVSEMGG